MVFAKLISQLDNLKSSFEPLNYQGLSEQISQDAEKSLLGEFTLSLPSSFLGHYDFRTANLSTLQFPPVIEFWQKPMPVLYCTHAQLGNQCMLHLREAQKASQSYCIIVCLSVLSSAAESRGGVKRLVNKSLFRFHYCEQPNQDNTDLANPLRISVLSGNTFFPALSIFPS